MSQVIRDDLPPPQLSSRMASLDALSHEVAVDHRREALALRVSVPIAICAQVQASRAG